MLTFCGMGQLGVIIYITRTNVRLQERLSELFGISYFFHMSSLPPDSIFNIYRQAEALKGETSPHSNSGHWNSTIGQLPTLDYVLQSVWDSARGLQSLTELIRNCSQIQITCIITDGSQLSFQDILAPSDFLPPQAPFNRWCDERGTSNLQQWLWYFLHRWSQTLTKLFIPWVHFASFDSCKTTADQYTWDLGQQAASKQR